MNGQIIEQNMLKISEDFKQMVSTVQVETLKQIEAGTAPREKQSDDFSIAPMLDKEMSKIDWNKSAREIKNLVRGLNPIMGGLVSFDGKKIKYDFTIYTCLIGALVLIGLSTKEYLNNTSYSIYYAFRR